MIVLRVSVRAVTGILYRTVDVACSAVWLGNSGKWVYDK
jgi:hypothetical protein